MPHSGQDPALLLDMMDSARAIVQMVSEMTYGAYAGDRRTRRAIEREVEIIGEAARKVSRAFQEAHPEVPWRRIVAQRHKLAHEYGEIEDEILWRVATVHIPELVALLEPLTPPSALEAED
ncbi:MAG: HepT-like ribonuclease domain-containing protein [Phycisphaerae bacterium]